MNLTIQFLYNLDLLSLYEPNLTDFLVFLVVGVLVLIMVYFIFLYSIGALLLFRDNLALKSKKKTLSDLILMKDIQTEMEKELEQASLRATFQG